MMLRPMPPSRIRRGLLGAVRQRGFTLVELLVGLVVGMLVIASAIGVFVAQQSSAQIARGQQELQQQARFVLDVMARDLRAAGDFSCVPGITPVNVLASATAAGYPFDQGGLRGAHWNGSTLSNLPAWRGASDVSQARSDVLVAYGLLSASVLHAAMGSSGDLSLDVRKPFSGWQAGDVLLLSDCRAAAVFQASAVAAHATDATRITVTRAAGAGLGQAFGKGAVVGRLMHTWYWIAQPADGNPRGLYRRLAGASSAMLLGDLVQQMQLRYDVDSNADGLADSTDLEATAVTDWTRVIRVRIKLLMRSREALLSQAAAYRFPSTAASTTTAPDRHLYQVVEQAVRLRNPVFGP